MHMFLSSGFSIKTSRKLLWKALLETNVIVAGCFLFKSKINLKCVLTYFIAGNIYNKDKKQQIFISRDFSEYF